MSQEKKEFSIGTNAKLVPVNDYNAAGDHIMSANLHVGDVEMFCSFQKALPVPPRFEGAKFYFLRPACNSRCANFKVTTMDKTVPGPEGSTTTNKITVAVAKLSCGAGQIWELESDKQDPPADLKVA
jgi:hypothetical protein